MVFEKNYIIEKYKFWRESLLKLRQEIFEFWIANMNILKFYRFCALRRISGCFEEITYLILLAYLETENLKNINYVYFKILI